MSELEETIELLEDKIRKATALRLMIDTEGWEILLETFEDMKQNQLVELSEAPLHNDALILKSHLVWRTTIHTLDQIVNAINNAVQTGEAARVELEILKQNPQEDWL